MSASPVALLVEDDALLVLNIEEELSKAGIQIFSAMHGPAATAEIDSAPTRFFCLVTDIRLGAGMDGWAVARHARSQNPQIIVVYVTGDSEGAWQAQGVPGSILLKKPLVNGQLAAAIAPLMSARG